MPLVRQAPQEPLALLVQQGLLAKLVSKVLLEQQEQLVQLVRLELQVKLAK